ncbi:MAG: VacJ family lipoprotein [Syntrophales bacterium]|jgi:phospholipid-binding lipoprotein MlaA|nr:VacJ family lipoprotein [Syntrophales bacterium]
MKLRLTRITRYRGFSIIGIALVVACLPFFPFSPALHAEESPHAEITVHITDGMTESLPPSGEDAFPEETVLPGTVHEGGRVADPVWIAEDFEDDFEYEDDFDISGEEQSRTGGPHISDPIEPFNRAMFLFNDKLYFWVLKPVATGYNKILPKVMRVSVKNFFTNLAFPIRFVSSLLQADFNGTAIESGRFFINSIWGIAGFMDLASMEGINLPKQDTDLGQTFGLWGIGQGVYIVWPFLGPSSPRETFGFVGEYFLYPVSYINPWYVSTGIRGYEILNDTSLRIGDYEALVGAAIDPYIATRDAYVQYRHQKIEKKRQKLWNPVPEEQPTE